MKWRWFVLLPLLLSMTGCKGDAADEGTGAAPAQVSQLIRGEYLFGHEVRVLRPCGEEEDLWVIDRTGILAELYEGLVEGNPNNLRIRVIATGHMGSPPSDGFGAEYPGSVTIEEVIYAAREGFGCDLDLTSFIYRAYGNEPFWHVGVYDDHMKLTWPGSPLQVWTEVTREDRGDTIVFRGSGTENPAVLTIFFEPGHDDMSGAYFNHRAQFQWGDHDMQGPALEGQAGGTR